MSVYAQVFLSHTMEYTMNTERRFLIVLVVLLCGVFSEYAAAQPKFQAPVLITSAGQSADVTMAGMLCKRTSIEAKSVPLAAAADLKGIKTLIIVPGFSSKGLGAAGTSREQELERVRDLVAAAREKKIPIVMLHLGGKARRGAQSDDFNLVAAEAAKTMIVVKQGNEDGFFSAISTEKKIPLELVDKIAAVTTPLSAAFK